MTDNDKLALFAAAAYQALLTHHMEVSPRRPPGWEEQLARDAWAKSKILLDAEPRESA